MLVLGIETTCDETAAAVIERAPDGSGRILSNIVRSQVEEHARFGGVVPEIAARAHVDVLDGIIDRAMHEAGIDYAQLDGVAAAAGPGLIGGVIVGLTTAKAIAMVHDTPLVAVNHLEAHALTPRLTDGVEFPYCLFLASGGHTQIVAVTGVGQYVRLGTTVDDAIGEAFDKVAKMLGLPYPGGPQVERAAANGDATRFAFPRPMQGRPDANFSLSGLKTAVRTEASRLSEIAPQDINDLCASFQAAVLDSTADRLRVGLRLFREQFGAPRALVAAGGVAANQAIRGALYDVARRSADAADHAAARALHRQWRDDRLGRRRTPRARHHRHDGSAAARALAARRQRHRARRLRQDAGGILAMAAFQSVAVIGAGAWGTALATVAARAGRNVTLWARNAEHADAYRIDPRQSAAARRAARAGDRRDERAGARRARRHAADRNAGAASARRGQHAGLALSRSLCRSSPAPRASSTAPTNS